MLEARLEHQTLKVKALLEEYRAGRIVVPEFQREYVWKKKRAPKLIDSLYRGYPVSSLLLWASTEDVQARRSQPRPSHARFLSWLIDGQQRVITLSRCLSGEEIDVVFNPDTEQFALPNAATVNDKNWFHLSQIWDDESYRDIRRTIADGPRAAQREKRFEDVRKILDYEVPTVRMVDHSFDGAVEAFTRINTLGVKLKREDIESARVAAQHSGFIVDEVAPFLAEMRKNGFTRLNVMHLFRICAFVAKPDGRDRTPLHELDRREVQAAWTTTKRATISATNVVRSEFGLVNMDILWSGALLVPVIALCASQGNAFNANEAAGWLAIASLLHRYSQGVEGALDQDLRACRDDDPIGKLLTNVRKDIGALKAIPNDFDGPLVDRGALFGVYVACRNRGMKDLFTGANIILQPQIDRHHLLPRAQFPASKRSDADNVANIAFVASSTNRGVGAASPDVYLSRLRAEVLTSQCIPIDKNLWNVDKAEEFLEARRELLCESFNDFLRDALPGRRL